MAQRYRPYDEGTPQRALQDAVAALYPDRQMSFFEAVAKRARVTPKSASGTFYKLLRDDGTLPPNQRAAYIALGVDEAILDTLLSSLDDEGARVRLQRVEADVKAIRKDLEDLRVEIGRSQPGHRPTRGADEPPSQASEV